MYFLGVTTLCQLAASISLLVFARQVYFLNLSRGIRLPETILNGAEIKLFRLPAFNGSKKVSGLDRFPTTFEEAGSRLIYTAVCRVVIGLLSLACMLYLFAHCFSFTIGGIRFFFF